MSLIPIKLFVNEKGMAKVELGLGKGKKLFDKREDLKERRASTTDAIRDRISDRKAHLKDRLSSSTDAIRKRFQDRAKDRVKNSLEKIFNRFDAALERLDGISSRIQSRIDTLDEAGADTSDAQDALDSADAEADAAASAISDARQALEDVINSEDEVSKEGIREVINEAKEAIKSAYSAYKEAIRILKAVDRPESDEDESDEE